MYEKRCGGQLEQDLLSLLEITSLKRKYYLLIPDPDLQPQVGGQVQVPTQPQRQAQPDLRQLKHLQQQIMPS